MLIPFSPEIIGVIFALTSAAVWGGGDFTGGLATRRHSQYQVLALSALSGLLVLLTAYPFIREPFPSLRGIFFSALAGVSGAIGIAALYRGLSFGQAAVVAPTSGVIGAVVPVVYTALATGLPPMQKLAGFVLACAGIWLVASGSGSRADSDRTSILLAVLAGIGFGGFFVFFGLVDPGKIITPLILTRSLTLLTGLVLLRFNREPFLSIRKNPPALLAGILDAGGNLFYILARQYTRLDIAAVIASLYPASTVILAALIQKQQITRRHALGVCICLAAIVLITV